MKTLKQIIRRSILIITTILTTLLLISIVGIQIFNEQNRTYENASRTLTQMEHLLAENQTDMTETVHSYAQTCLLHAESIAYILEKDPSLINNTEELKKIAAFTEVDDIHIFDQSGTLIAGTIPASYGLTFDSGDQISYFKPMLKDKNLTLVQPITPNTAEAKQMQYTAVWSKDGSFILQIGMEPDSIIKLTEENELSHILSLFRVNPEAGYYAVDTESGEIVGSTSTELTGKHIEEIGLSMAQIQTDPDGFHAEVEGVHSFCVFKEIGDTYIGRVISSAIMYQRIPNFTISTASYLIILAVILYHIIVRYMKRYVTDSIDTVNEKLTLIAKGDLDETIDIQNSAEFSALSSYINEMVKTLLDNNKKMSYVLSRTDLYMGVYEHNAHMDRVRFTEYIPQILGLNEADADALSSDHHRFRAFIETIRRHPIPDEPNIFRIPGEIEKYVRLEEITEDDAFFGVCIDETEDILKRQKIEVERDYDLLTGLYNRRGLDRQLSILFQHPEKLGLGALIMIDADGLKQINDTYGHENGDLYLIKISEVIDKFGLRSNLSARQGGDEFVLLLYDYDSEDELQNTLRTLEYIQTHSTVRLGEDLNVPLRFSLGYALLDGTADTQRLFKEADERMYANKRERKQQNNA